MARRVLFTPTLYPSHSWERDINIVIYFANLMPGLKVKE